MTLTAPAPRAAAPDPPPRRRPGPWRASVASGVAVLLASGPVSAVVQGTGWLGFAGAAVAAVVGVGIVAGLLVPADRAPGRTVAAVAAAQVAAVLGLLTALFTDDGAFGVLPGPAALADMGGLLAGAGAQINVGIAPIEATPEILFLVTASLGLLAVAVHLAVVGAAAPAAAGIPLLAAFAVPAALADELLPWWVLAAAAAGFGLLLLATDGRSRQFPGGLVLVAAAVAVALLVGTLTAFVGTSGRFAGGGDGEGAGSIGLSPFTSLRGQLNRSTPSPLFEVRGLTEPAYLRALTLADYQAGVGWQATRPGPGVPAEGPFAQPPVPGTPAQVTVDNVGFRDYWLPVYGAPLALEGLTPGLFVYDEDSGIGYTARPAAEDGWTQSAFLPAPSTDLLRAAQGEAPAAIYSNILGVDPRIAGIAAEVTAGAATDFDRALALQEYFTGPGSEFGYDLATAPPEGDDALVEFLTIGQVGYCEQFASAMAVMLRTVGVPARVAVGFTAGTPVSDYRAISTADAHAWVEAWFPGVGWTTFDPTPLTDGRAIVPPYVEQARAEAAAGAAPAVPATPLPAAPTPAPDPAGTPAAQEPGSAPDAAAAPDPGPPLWPVAVVPVGALLALLPAGLRHLRRRERLAAAAAGGPGAAVAAWDELRAESADRGVAVPASDTVRSAARRLVREHRLDAAAQDALRATVTAVEASWFGDRHPDRHALTGPLAEVRAGMAGGSPLDLRARLLPRSVLAGFRRSARGDRVPDDGAAVSRS
ncbi:transglutaminase domain-containing protein [Pseudonocardia sp.]|uniref:transglutaminase family protein n=1 Tax=Pseudonocardia sp. TaxID=60912 RepID=UPI002623BC59|nr:transglutaminase domain-containing protein [Pseudonocardia sp.]